MNAIRSKPSFTWYLQHKLGRKGGRTAWFNFFIRPFAASSFAEFWRQWNPVYGYYLTYYLYRPLARTMPREVAAFITFVTCGLLLHDIPAWVVTRRVWPPGATIAFTFFGASSVASQRLHMDMSRLPERTRVTVNAAYVASGIAVMLITVRFLVRRATPAMRRGGMVTRR